VEAVLRRRRGNEGLSESDPAHEFRQAEPKATTVSQDVGARTLQGTRRIDVQGLRGVAVLSVVAFHAVLPLSGGFTGVDVFFVISGFVITGTLSRELSASGRIDLAAFYRRRVKRLFPPLAAMLAFVALAGILLDPSGTGHVSALTGIAAALFSANFYLYHLTTDYFAVDSQLNPLLHTWTLAVEEQFYLLFPALLLASWWVGRRFHAARAFAVTTIVVVSAVLFAVAIAWSSGSRIGGLGAPTRFAFYGSPARAWEFGLGSVVALASPGLRKLPAAAASGLAAFGLIAVGLASVGGSPNGPLLANPLVIAVLGAAALITAGTADAGTAVSKVLHVTPLVAVGAISYSWYLWHWPLIVFSRAVFPGSGWVAPVAAVASLVPAWASYRYLENPIRFNPRIRGRAVIALVAGCVAIPVAASTMLAATQSHLPLASAGALHADYLRHCDSPKPLGDPARSNCTWLVNRARGSIVLIGDSNAGQFTEPVTAAAARARLDTVVATNSDCPFAQLRVHFRVSSGCAQFNARSLAALTGLRPSLVIIAARTDAYIGSPDAELASIDSSTYHRDPAVRSRLFEQGLRRELTALTARGIPVIVIHPIPVLPVNQQACAVVLLLVSSCRGTLPRSRVDAQLRTAIAVERAAMRGLPLVSTLDFEAKLCGETECSSRRPGGGLIMYRDQDHLSVAGAITLKNAFYDAILAHATTM
jgi:peptidoglycan/LPS O-acetylase OafA/YrhL